MQCPLSGMDCDCKQWCGDADVTDPIPGSENENPN